MSFASDIDFKERVRSSVDLVDLMGDQLELRRSGSQFLARCPWHDDHRPSLTINPARQTWRCWPCDIGGDVFSFVMKRDGVNFREALELLAERAGIPIPQRGHARPAEPGSPSDKTTLLAAMRWAVDQYRRCLIDGPSAEAARRYATERGIDAATQEKFSLGYAPAGWDWLLSQARKEGFSPEVLAACGLVRERNEASGHYDMFRDRLLFPIFDLQGRPISLGGRLLPGAENAGGKYINGPETRLFSKSRQLYGLNWARDGIARQSQVLVMEGYTDVIATAQAGIENVVAVLGTALGSDHVRILNRFADTVVLVLDGDQAGQRRADAVVELFVAADVDLRVLTLPEGVDPADYVTQHGGAALEQAAAQAPDAIEHKLQRLTAGVDLIQDTHRATRAAEELLKLLARSPANASAIKVQQILQRLARTFAMPIETLQQRLGSLRSAQRRLSSHSASVPADVPERRSPSVHSPQLDSSNIRASDRFDEDASEGALQWNGEESRPATDRFTGIERELFRVLLEAPEFAGDALEIIHDDWLESDSARELLKLYQRLEIEGLMLDFDSLMLTIENESLKNHVVSLDEEISRRSPSVTQSPTERFQSVVARYRERHSQSANRVRLSQLKQGTISEQEGLDMLQELFTDQRLRHGLTRPSPGTSPPDPDAASELRPQEDR